MKIIKIKKVTPRKVYAIKTSTGTFIADGLAHHNCAFCNSRMNEDKFEGGRIFAENIIARYGERRLTYINTFINEEWSCKREIPMLLDMMLEILTLMKTRKTKPDYYKKLSTILHLH
jgi:hypothetical protein